MNQMRMIAFGFLGLAVVSTARVVAQQPAGIAVQPVSATDPLANALERCRQLNEKAENDQDCQAAYAENRKRFFTPPGPYVPGKVELFPNKQPWTTEKKFDSAEGEK